MFKVLGYVAGVVCALIMVLSVANVITRNLLLAPIFGTVELVSYGGLLMGALALAYNEIGDGNITMTLFVDTMKPIPKNLCNLFMSFLAACFYGAITYRYFQEILVAYGKGTFTVTLEIPLFIINTFMFVGFFVATLALLLKAVRSLVFLVKPAWFQAQGELQKEGDG